MDIVEELTGDGDLSPLKMQAENARAQVECRGQGTRTDTLSYDVTKLRGENGSGGGNSSGYLLRRLARDHPDILDRYEAGEFKSVRAAAKVAGIVKELTPFEQVQKLIKIVCCLGRALAARTASTASRAISEPGKCAGHKKRDPAQPHGH